MAVKPLNEGGTLASEATLGSPTPDLKQNIINIEKATYRLLPSVVTGALAQTGMDATTLDRAARLIARNFDLSPADLFPGTLPEDPYQPGKPLSLSTFRRLTSDAKPEIIRAMAPSLFAPSDERALERPWVTDATAARASRIIREVGPVLADYHPSAHEGVALAQELLKRGIDGKRYAANLRAVLAWYDLDKTTLLAGREIDWVELASLALSATEGKQKLRSAMDVRAFLFPEVGKLARESAAAQAANASASESWAMYAGGRGTKWLREGGDLGPVAQAVIAGDYNNADLQAFLDSRFGPSDERTKARETLRRQAEVEQQRLKLQAMGLDVNLPDIVGVSEAQKVLSDPNGDWFKGAQLLQGEILDSNTAFSRSAVGRSLGFVAEQLDALYKGLQIAPVMIAASIEKGLQPLLNEEAYRRDAVIYRQYLANIRAGKGLFETMAVRNGLPSWVGTAADFLYLVEVDPTIIAGKSLKGVRALKYAPGLVDKTTLTESLLLKVPGVKNYLGERMVRRLEQQGIDFAASARGFAEARAPELAKAFASGDSKEILRFVRRFGVHEASGAGLDEGFLLKAQRAFTRRSLEAGSKQAVSEAQHVLEAMFFGKARAGSVAAEAWTSHAIAVEAAKQAVEQEAAAIQGRLFEPWNPAALLPNNSTVDMVDTLIRDHTFNPMMLEVPYRYRPIPGFGLKQTLRNAALEGEGTALGRSARQLVGVNPGNLLNVHEDPGRWARLVAVRSKQFTNPEIDEIVAKVQMATVSRNPEAALRATIEKNIIEGVVERTAVSRGLPPELLPTIRAEMDKSFGAWRKEAFGVVDDKVLGRMMLETQRVNELFFPDVLQVKKFVHAVANAYDDFVKSSPDDVAKLLAGEATLAPKTGAVRSITDEIVNRVVFPVTRGWKMWVVPRAGYVGRVVLLDESIRQLATGVGIFERLANTNIDDAVARLLDVQTLGTRNLPFVGKAIGKVTDTAADLATRPLSKAVEALYPTTELRFGDDVVRLGLPSRDIAYEPFANTVGRQKEVLEDLMKRSSQIDKNLRLSDNWGKVTPDNPIYFGAWQHALNDTFHYSLGGKAALRAVAEGKTLAETTATLLEWTKTAEGRVLLRRIGWAADDAAEWADLMGKMVHGYTAGDRKLAALALERGVDEEILRRIPASAHPTVHGPLLAEVTAGNGNPLKTVINYWFETFVQQPENILNRQPYYRAIKRRAEKAYLNIAKMGLTDGQNLGADALAAIDAASRDYALKQVKRIMFDFSENSRIGELLFAVAPFMQPFMEAFSVYGNILWHRNPALIPYAAHLWDAGKSSGFIRKDEQTNGYVIPVSWWAGSAAVLQNWAHVPGAELIAPVQSLNLFVNSGLKLPDGTPLLGGATVPLPSLSPWTQAILQKFFKDTKSESIASWLFAYGPDVNPIPSAFRKALAGRFPELFDQGLVRSIAMDYIIDYQYRGIYQDLGPTELMKQAMKDAQRHMDARAYASFFGVGTPIVRWEWAPIRQEFFDLIEANGGDVQAAKEQFLTKYPAYGAMTVGKTSVGENLQFLDSKGEIIPGSLGLRIPSTEYARQFLNSDAGKELAKQGFMPLIGALLMQADPNVGENDFATYSQLLANNYVQTKPLYQRDAKSGAITGFIADVELVGLADDNPRLIGEHEGFWGAVNSFYDYKKAQELALREQGFKSNDERFAQLDQQETEFLTSLYNHFPATASTYLDRGQEGVSWRYGASGLTEPDQLTVARIKQFAAMPQLQGFRVVEGLNYYLPELDRIREVMIDNGINSIKDTGALDLGLDKEYQAVLDKLDADYPEAAYVVSTFLRGVLESAPTRGELTKREWQKNSDPRYQQYLTFEADYRALTSQLPLPDLTDVDKAAIYTEIGDLFSRTYQASPDVIQAWWDSKTYPEREQYKDGLVTKYVGYMNLWDLHLIGVDVKPETYAKMRAVQDARLEIQRQEEANPDYNASDAYDRLDKVEVALAAGDPAYREVLNAQRTWGYALARSSYVEGDSRAAAMWRNVRDLLTVIQARATTLGLTGSVYGSQANKETYKELRSILGAVIRSYYESDEGFKSQWTALSGGEGYDLLSVLMPDYYFDYPLGPVSPRQAA